MSLLIQLNEDMKTAMKAGDKARLSTVRMLVSAVRYAGIDQGEMTDEKVIAVLQKEAKKRRESIEAFTKGGRMESAEQEKTELFVIETYLPKMMSEEEVRGKVENVLKSVNPGESFGLVMQKVMGELKGQADGGTISKIVREIYK